jgi:long-chain acyl-CoA synthetase
MYTAGACVEPKSSILTIMPAFHGFGLGVSIHTPLIYGMKCILIPQFTPETYGKIVKNSKPNVIAGVPTLYEAMITNPILKTADLSFLTGIFSGGDTLSVESKRKIDSFLKERNCKVQVREGYGMTESVTGSCLCPKDIFREGSVGIPLPDMYYKIVTPGTAQEVPPGTDGEICVLGPTVMMGYINNIEENEQTLQTHSDGNVWLHTGDLGCMDADGFVYFRQRIKRMIITSGYNVYPSQLENIIEGHDAVLSSCIIGVPDQLKIQKIKAFIVLKPEHRQSNNIEKIKEDIIKHCRDNIAKYAFPYEFEYRDDLPRTLVGKVAYLVLEKEEAEKCK